MRWDCRALAYGVTAFSVASIHNIWVTYNYPFFLERLAQGPWFVMVEIVFGVWNAVNDPILGWLSDTADATQGHRRTKHIRRGGGLLAASFMFAWFPWSQTGGALAALHFLIALCLYDGALTYVEVNYHSLLIDVSSSPEERANCNFYASVFSIFGAGSAAVAHVMWQDASPAVFRTFCVFVALMALPGFEITSRLVHEDPHKTVGYEMEDVEDMDVLTNVFIEDERRHSLGGDHDTGPQQRIDSDERQADKGKTGKPSSLSFRLFLSQLSSQRNFAIFSVVRLIQVFICTFEKSHLALFLQFLVGEQLPKASLGGLVAMSFVLPHLGILAATYAMRRWSLYAVIRAIFATKALLSLVGVWCVANGEPVTWWAIVAFLTSSRILTECICRLFPLVISELVDEDQQLHQRSQSMAASIVGTSALVAKPGESLAPILGFYLLRFLGQSSSSSPSSLPSPTVSAAGLLGATGGGGEGEGGDNRDIVLGLLVLLPLLSSAVQLLLWTQYRTKRKPEKSVA